MTALALFAAFWVGSIPFSWLLVWWMKGVDLRTVGSGNPGATNAMRVVGRGWGSFAMALDVSKGLASTLAVPLLATGQADWIAPACGCLAILGNVFCPFFRFRGGKAVATAGGVFLGLAPLTTLVVMALFFSILGITKKTSIGSLTSALVLPLLISVQAWKSWGDHPSVWVVALVWAAAVLVILRHRDNIRRLIQREETGV